MRDEMSKKNLLSFLLVLIVVLAAVLVYALLRGPSEPNWAHESEGILHKGAPPQFYPNGSYPPVPVVWAITLTKNFSAFPIGTEIYLLDTDKSLTGIGYSAYSHFIRDPNEMALSGASFSDGEKVGFNGQLVTSKDINGNTFYGVYGNLTLSG
jgi:hypothetical protein